MRAFGVLCRGMRPWMEQQLVPESIRVWNLKYLGNKSHLT